MVVAAIGAAAIGQVLDGGLLIVIFATSGALEAVATQRTADSVRHRGGPQVSMRRLVRPCWSGASACSLQSAGAGV